MGIIFTAIFTTNSKTVKKAGYKSQAECNKFDRFMNTMCHKLGLISRLE